MRKKQKPAKNRGAQKRVVNPRGLFNSLEYGFSRAVVA